MSDTITLTIDGKEISVPKGATVLDAAREADIYIPTLCTHKDLPAFGACRLCLVQVENMRGFPPSCTTPAGDGMVVTTDSEELGTLRRGVLELLLSEHPSSCIVCDEREMCFKYNRTPSKVGVSTGCRFCPNRDQCELFDIAEYLGVKELRIPIKYKGLPKERGDPFFERDYNLCILCGRCVRVCTEIRGNGAIAFTKRGHDTVVGTAFGKSHVDGDCRFCGACVDVCPTGSLMDKSTQWGGKPEGTTTTVCGLCSVGCTMNVEYNWDVITRARPDEDGPVNGGQACLMGRFCLPTLFNGNDRLRYPSIRKDGELTPVDWDEAIAFVREKLGGYQPEEVGFLASPDLTNEGAYALQKYARDVIGTPNIDVISGLLRPVLNTMVRSGVGLLTVRELEDMEVIVMLGGNPGHTHPLLTVPVHKAMTGGAQVIHVTRENCPGCMATEHQVVGSIHDWCDKLFSTVRGKKAAVLFGEEILEEYPEDIIEVALASGAGLMPLFAGCNALGTAGVGAMAGSLLGHKGTEVGFTYPRMMRNVKALLTTQAVTGSTEGVDFMVLVDIYPSETMEEADVVLPAAAFTETAGTITNLERRVQELGRVVDPPGMALPDWKIFSMLGDLGYDEASQATAEFMEKLGMDGLGLWSPGPSTIKKVKPERYEVLPPRYRGMPVSDRVTELEELFRHWGVIR